MRFTGTAFDTTTLTQLTFEGRNFFPAWRPDGQWITYDRSIADASGPQGLWVMRNDGTDRRFLIGGRMPDWASDGAHLIYIGLLREIFRVKVSDTTEIARLTSFNQADPYSRDNRNPRYSPDGTKIAFWSQAPSQVPQLWVMNADGTNPRQLTTEGADLFSWSPDGRQLVYVHYSYRRADLNNGTLWIMNADGSNKLQLTFNHGLTFVP
jgi:Tol biopolymer transport system component